MNNRHLNNSDSWGTPKWVLDKSQEVLDQIDLDPASSLLFNNNVQAKQIWTAEDNSLSFDWDTRLTKPVSVFMNPPSGKLKGKSIPALFWQKIIDLKNQHLLTEAIVIAYSIEQLQTTQKCSEAMLDFPICLLKKRLRFEDVEGTPRKGPTHSNAIIYVPGLIDNTSGFARAFIDLGQIVTPYFGGSYEI